MLKIKILKFQMIHIRLNLFHNLRKQKSKKRVFKLKNFNLKLKRKSFNHHLKVKCQLSRKNSYKKLLLRNMAMDFG